MKAIMDPADSRVVCGAVSTNAQIDAYLGGDVTTRGTLNNAVKFADISSGSPSHVNQHPDGTHNVVLRREVITQRLFASEYEEPRLPTRRRPDALLWHPGSWRYPMTAKVTAKRVHAGIRLRTSPDSSRLAWILGGSQRISVDLRNPVFKTVWRFGKTKPAL